MTTAQEIAKFLDASLEGPPSTDAITVVSSLSSPKPGALFFVKKWSADIVNKLARCSIGLALVPLEGKPKRLNFPHIALDNPRLAYAKVTAKFFSERLIPYIAPTAIIHPSAKIGQNVSIGHYTVIGPGVEISDGTIIRNRAVLHANIHVGKNCLIKSGAIIGEEGFGFEKDENNRLFRIPHFGGVVIGNHVEIGSNTVIAGGTIDPTCIGDHTKIDDCVFIAHNVQIAENCAIIATSMLSGSARVGQNTWIAPGACVINNVSIGSHVTLGMGAIVTKPVEDYAVMGGARATLIRYNR